MVKVAVIGSGSIATHRHAPEYAAHPDVDIVAFVDRVPDRAAKLAKKYGATLREYDSFAHHIILEPGWEAPAAEVVEWLDALPSK